MENQEPQSIQPQAPVQPAPEPSFEPKKSFPKWSLIIVGVILLATLLTGAFILSKNLHMNQKSASKTPTTIKSTPIPTPNLIADWKTYTNERYGFSFNYPKYLQKVDDKLPEFITNNGSVNNALRISSADSKENLDVYINPHFGGMCNPTWIYKAKLNGEKLEITKTKGPPNSSEPQYSSCDTYSIATIALLNNNVLSITFGYKDNISDPEKDFEKLINSFTFTDGLLAWKTYDMGYFYISFPSKFLEGTVTNLEKGALVAFQFDDSKNFNPPKIQVLYKNGSIENFKSSLDGELTESMLGSRKVIKGNSKIFEYHGGASSGKISGSFYEILVADGQNTLIMEGGLSQKDIMEKMLSTILFKK